MQLLQLTQYIVPLNTRAVVTHLGMIAQMLGAVLVLPILMAILMQEFFYSGLFGGLAAGTYLFGRLCVLFKTTELELKEALVVTAAAYLFFSLIGAIPFLPVAPFLDSFFEAVSSFTTTGLSTLNVEQLPRSLLFFRSYAQWLGGGGIIIFSLAVLFRPGKAAFRLYGSEFGEENLRGSVISTARIVLKIYLSLTVLGFLAFLGAGMGPFDALVHILSTVSTGGFSAYTASIGYYHNPLITGVVILFMISGAISFPVYYLLWLEGPKRSIQDPQLRYLLGLLALSTLLFLGEWGWDGVAFLPSLFETTSALTTTGFNVSVISSWPEPLKLLSVLLMSIGGAAGSTAGGFKLLRFIVVLKVAGWMLLRNLLPEEAKFPIKYHDQVLSESSLQLLFGFFTLSLILVACSTFLLVLGGFSMIDALFESVSALSTVGLSAGVTSSGLAGWAKLLLIFNMWAGRLEILPVLVLLYPGIWKARRTP